MFLKLFITKLYQIYTLECTQLNHILKNFLEEHTLNLTAIQLHDTHRTTTQTGCITIPRYPHYLKNDTTSFVRGFLPLINDISFGHPPPPNNDRVCDHIAMQVFPQEKILHYTTIYNW